MDYFHWAIARAVGIAKQNRQTTRETLRDLIDMKTGGELDCGELDLLVDRAMKYQQREAAKDAQT